MLPLAGSIRRWSGYVSGVPKRVLRSVVAVGALLAMVGLSGCWGRNWHYYSGGGGGEYYGNNALWVANGTDVVEFATAQLVSGTSDPTPHRTITSSVFGAPQGVVFDGYGDLWVIDGGTVATGGKVAPALYEFTAQQLSQLGTNSSPTPAVTITSAGFVFPQQAVFDGRGNLWVTDDGANTVDVFTAKQLSTTASSDASGDDDVYTGV